MKMLKGNIILIVVLAVFSVVTLWGCAGNLPEGKRAQNLDMNWGKSFEAAKNKFSVVTLWGCAGNLPEGKRAQNLDMNWGKSFEAAKNNQILNPEAGKTVEPVSKKRLKLQHRLRFNSAEISKPDKPEKFEVR
jgi:hypothetical protein